MIVGRPSLEHASMTMNRAAPFRHALSHQAISVGKPPRQLQFTSVPPPTPELETFERDRGRVQIGGLVVRDAKVLLEVGPVDMPVRVETLRNTKDVASLVLVNLARLPIGNRYRSLNDINLLVSPKSLPWEHALTRLRVTTGRQRASPPHTNKQRVGARTLGSEEGHLTRNLPPGRCITSLVGEVERDPFLRVGRAGASVKLPLFYWHGHDRLLDPAGY